MPKFSVIITVYNVSPWLRRGLDSVLAAAAGFDVEVICVDDGSTDESGGILDEYARRSTSSTFTFRVIHQENTGTSIARQHGLDRATGDWVLFADPDDTVGPDFVRSFETAIAGRDVDMVWCDYFREEDHNVHRISTRTENESDSHLKSVLEDRVWGVVWNKAFRRSFIAEHAVRFLDVRLNEIDDLCFVSMFLFHKPRIAWVDACNYHYVIRATSSTGCGWHEDGFLRRANAYVKLGEFFAATPYADLILFRKKRLKFFTYLEAGISDSAFAKAFPEIRDIDDMAVGIWHKVLFRVAVRGGRSCVIRLMKVGRAILRPFRSR